MMTLRRMVMAQMASGAQFAKGTFTIADSGSGNYVLNFGKTFSKYFYIIEMTDESKTALLDTGINNIKVFCTFGVHPLRSVNNVTATSSNRVNCRLNPRTGEVSMSINGNPVTATDSQSITCNYGAINLSAYYLFNGYSYNYYVVEIKD